MLLPLFSMGVLKFIADNNIPVLLRNYETHRIIAMSQELLNGDNMLVSQNRIFDTSYFYLELIGGNRFRLKNKMHSDYWAFVSHDTKGGDNVLEMHRSQHENRNIFEIHMLNDGGVYTVDEETFNAPLFHIYNPEHGKWLFDSNDQSLYGNVIEAHSNWEERNFFWIHPCTV